MVVTIALLGLTSAASAQISGQRGYNYMSGDVKVATATTQPDATWTATFEKAKDNSPSCDGWIEHFADYYTITIKNNVLSLTPDAQHKDYATWRMNLSKLNADGSGTATSYLIKNKQPMDFVLERGLGARTIKFGNRFKVCRFVLTPR
jgi:hypothetical protein